MNYFIKELEQIPNKSPQETFDDLIKSSKEIHPMLKVISIIGWNIITQNIIYHQKQVSYFYQGMILCTSCIDNLLGNKNAKITETDLELGTECIKSLNDIFIDQNTNWDKEEKKIRKHWIKIFLDIWKEYMKKAIKEE